MACFTQNLFGPKRMPMDLATNLIDEILVLGLIRFDPGTLMIDNQGVRAKSRGDALSGTFEYSQDGTLTAIDYTIAARGDVTVRSLFTVRVKTFLPSFPRESSATTSAAPRGNLSRNGPFPG